VFGFYKGALHPGADTHVIHGRTLPQEIESLRCKQAAQLAARPHRGALSIANKDRYREKACSRVGSDFQVEIPPFLPEPSKARRRKSSPQESAWRPDELSGEAVDAFQDLLCSRKLLLPVQVGCVTMVHLPEISPFAHRLCCVLESYPDGSVRVFDGKKDWVVPLPALKDTTSFREGELEQALQLLLQHGGLTPALLHDVDELLRSASVPALPWTSAEVKVLLALLTRFGDNIRRVWEHLRRAKSSQTPRSLVEVQEFFLSVYPHAQYGVTELVHVYYRGELAANGFPDGEESEEDEDEEEGEYEDEGEEEEGEEVDEGMSEESESRGSEPSTAESPRSSPSSENTAGVRGGDIGSQLDDTSPAPAPTPSPALASPTPLSSCAPTPAGVQAQAGDKARRGKKRADPPRKEEEERGPSPPVIKRRRPA